MSVSRNQYASAHLVEVPRNFAQSRYIAGKLASYIEIKTFLIKSKADVLVILAVGLSLAYDLSRAEISRCFIVDEAYQTQQSRGRDFGLERLVALVGCNHCFRGGSQPRIAPSPLQELSIQLDAGN